MYFVQDMTDEFHQLEQKQFYEQENRWPIIPSDHTGPIIVSSHLPGTETIVSLPLCLHRLSVFILVLVLSIFSLLFSFLTSPLPPPPCDLLPRALSPPCWWLVKSGGCWGSSQSCKWGSSPGWPRHSVVQVRKPATLPTEQRWER